MARRIVTVGESRKRPEVWYPETREKLLKSPGRGEDEVADFLTSLRVPFVRQRQVGQYFIDLTLENYRIAIEVDDPGKDLDSERQVSRTQFLSDRGWTLLRLDSHRVVLDPGYLQSMLLRTVQSLAALRGPRDFPRQRDSRRCICGCSIPMRGRPGEYLSNKHRRRHTKVLRRNERKSAKV